MEKPADDREECCAEIESRRLSNIGETAASGTFFCLMSDFKLVRAAIFVSTEAFGFFKVSKTSEALDSIFHIFIHAENDHAETIIEGKRSRNAVFWARRRSPMGV